MEKVKLGDIAVLINGDRGKNYPSQADITEEGDVPFVNAGHLTGRTIDFGDMNYISKEKYEKLSSGKFEKGDILYCLRGSLGKKAIVNDDVAGAIASSLVIIRPDYEKIDGDYLMFSLDSPSIKEQLVKANNGSSQPNLSAASVREYQIELPDISHQKEVVEKLTRVRNVIDERQKELNLLDELIKARFVELFGSISNNKFGYEVMTLQDVCEPIKDGTHQTPTYTEDTVNGYKFLSSKDVTSGKVDWNHLKYIPEELHKELYKRISPRKGDILLAKNGTTGVAAIVDRDDVFDIYVSLALLRPLGMVTSEYLCSAVNSIETKHQFDSSLKGIGVPNLHLGEIKKTKIVVPPIEAQEQFADFVKQVDKSKVAVQRSLEETQKLFDSLMQEYFG
ncbi:restriction endonuclease subunit S [[Clostridium] aminophilum]|uniref:restriction endonuclease subunit S n=1 Tax=[Clostridium] aminophilum TaxID=1526 RepID=UPI003332C6F2